MSDGALAQQGERGLCKPEVRGSIPLCSTKNPDGSSSEDPFSLRSASRCRVRSQKACHRPPHSRVPPIRRPVVHHLRPRVPLCGRCRPEGAEALSRPFPSLVRQNRPAWTRLACGHVQAGSCDMPSPRARSARRRQPPRAKVASKNPARSHSSTHMAIHMPTNPHPKPMPNK